MAFQDLNVILNQKICIYQQKEEQPILKILSNCDNTLKLVPNIFSLRIRQISLIDEELSIPQVEIELNQQYEQISMSFSMKSLSKKNNSEIEKWKISESFYTPKSNRKYGDSLLYYKQKIFDYKKTEFKDLNIQNISLIQGVIGISSIPYQLCGIFLGVPMYQKCSYVYEQKITIEEIVASLKKLLKIVSNEKVVGFLYKIQSMQLSPIAMFDEINQKLLELYKEVQDLQNTSQFVLEIIVAKYFLNIYSFKQQDLFKDIIIACYFDSFPLYIYSLLCSNFQNNYCFLYISNPSIFVYSYPEQIIRID
ncbi:hypothetical protein ABPG72_018394 [Tetrahymena utriculariae]